MTSDAQHSSISKIKQKSLKSGVFEAENYLIMNTEKFLKSGVVMLVNSKLPLLLFAMYYFWKDFNSFCLSSGSDPSQWPCNLSPEMFHFCFLHSKADKLEQFSTTWDPREFAIMLQKRKKNEKCFVQSHEILDLSSLNGCLIRGGRNRIFWGATTQIDTKIGICTYIHWVATIKHFKTLCMA